MVRSVGADGNGAEGKMKWASGGRHFVRCSQVHKRTRKLYGHEDASGWDRGGSCQMGWLPTPWAGCRCQGVRAAKGVAAPG